MTDSAIQEIDLRTGLVRARVAQPRPRRRWPTPTAPPTHPSTRGRFDYFHLNSIDQRADGTTLISARNTWALYELNTATGQVLCSGSAASTRASSSRTAHTAYQHDADMLPDGTISVFDNGAVPKVHPQSRGLVLARQPAARHGDGRRAVTSTARRADVRQPGQHPARCRTATCSSAGDRSRTSRSSAPSGQLLFDAHLHGSYQSYRGYRFPWTGDPGRRPRRSSQSASGGTADRLRELERRHPHRELAPARGPSRLDSSPRGARRPAQRVRDGDRRARAHGRPYVAVQALDASGAVIGTSDDDPRLSAAAAADDRQADPLWTPPAARVAGKREAKSSQRYRRLPTGTHGLDPELVARTSASVCARR